MFVLKRVRESSYFHTRCKYCTSTRYNAQRSNMVQKATATHREHADKMVRKGFAPTRAVAIQLMNGSGVTKDFIAAMFREYIGKECPGMCGWPNRHRMTEYPDLQFDWRDPRYPLTPENCGPLCGSCNPQKNDSPWPEFMACQRAIRMSLDQAVAFGPRPVQEALFPL